MLVNGLTFEIASESRSTDVRAWHRYEICG